mgnify:CR=1 FL=1
MSQEDLTQFLEAVREDSSLQEQLKAEGADPVAIAKDAGFSITRAELNQTSQLNDKELEQVAGGATFKDTECFCTDATKHWDRGPINTAVTDNRC